MQRGEDRCGSGLGRRLARLPTDADRDDRRACRQDAAHLRLPPGRGIGLPQMLGEREAGRRRAMQGAIEAENRAAEDIERIAGPQLRGDPRRGGGDRVAPLRRARPPQALRGEQQRYLTFLLRDQKRSGLGLPKAVRSRGLGCLLGWT